MNVQNKKTRIFVIAKPTSIDAIKETFVARYPNGKVAIESK